MGVKFYLSLIAMVGLILAAIYKQFLLSDLDQMEFLFIYSIPSNMAISLFPHEPLVVYFGKTYDPIRIAAIVMGGTWIAGLLDYYVFVPILSHRFTGFITNTKDYQKSAEWFMKQPFWALVVAGFTPVPFFVFKFIAFSAHYSILKYMLALLIGRFPRYYLLALIGAVYQIPSNIILYIFIGMILIYILRWWKDYRFNRQSIPNFKPEVEDISS